MKKILYILAAALCLLTSCEKQIKFPEKLYGDWFCQSTSLAGTEVSVYVSFNGDSFMLYQKIGEGAYRIYNGTYTLTTGTTADGISGYILSGEYYDGTPWGADYLVESSSNDVMTLTAGGVTETYTRVTGGIPEEVKSSAVTVRSADTEEVRFF